MSKIGNKDHPVLALVGNPNCGKTELFNCLTGKKQKVGNWPGVTVDKIEGTLIIEGEAFHLVDLPGCYACDTQSQQHALDEAITTNFLANGSTSIIINVVHAQHLQRHLYLTLQLLETGIPLIIAVNMMDQLNKDGLICHFEALAGAMNCVIIPISAKYKSGINALKEAIKRQHYTPSKTDPCHLPPVIQNAATTLALKLPNDSPYPRWTALRLLENSDLLSHDLSTTTIDELDKQKQELTEHFKEDLDIMFAQLRYQIIAQWLPTLYERTRPRTPSWTNKIDRLLLNRWFGIPFFLAMMYLLFLICVDVSHCFQEPLDTLSSLWLIQAPSALMTQHHISSTLIHFYQQSIGTAMTTTLSFMPILAILFFLLSILEHSGYMARAAFVMDKIMGILKLPGRSFVSLLIGFGCNVPAIMSTRTLSNQQDRIVTAMMSPFMSCSARLAVYVIFVQACFPQGGHNIIFLLYFTGIGIAILTGLLLRFTHFQQQREPLTLELPKYQIPSIKLACQDSKRRVIGFLKRTIRFMLPACCVLAGLQMLPALPLSNHPSASLLEQIAQWLTPLFSPLGLEANNWPATVALLLGSVAKEVMVGVLNTLYSLHTHQLDHMPNLLEQSWQAIQQIGPLLKSLMHNLAHPLKASLSSAELNQTSKYALQQHFSNPQKTIAFLLFTCLYIPCFSTIAIIRKELSSYWAIFATIWSVVIAYVIAGLYYQSTTWHNHPIQTISWYLGCLGFLACATYLIRHFRRQEHGSR